MPALFGAVAFALSGALLTPGASRLGSSVPSVLVPFAANWHPVAVAWGVIALYLLAPSS